MPPVKTFGERIADALVEDGLLNTKQVEDLLAQQKKEGTRLLKLILEKAYVSDQDMAVSIGRVLNTPPINLARISIPLDVADLANCLEPVVVLLPVGLQVSGEIEQRRGEALLRDKLQDDEQPSDASVAVKERMISSLFR